MTTLTFHLTPEQLADPEILRKLRDFSESLKPRVPTPEEVEAERAKIFEQNKLIFKLVANLLNSQIEKRTGKKVGVTDKAIFELYLSTSGKQDLTKIVTAWMLPLFAFFSTPSAESSSTPPRSRCGPSLSRRSESVCASSSPDSTEETRSSSTTSDPYAQYADLGGIIRAAVNIIAPPQIAPNDGMQDLAANIIPQFMAGMQAMFAQPSGAREGFHNRIDQIAAAVQSNSTSYSLPTNPSQEEMLHAIFENMASETPKSF